MGFYNTNFIKHFGNDHYYKVFKLWSNPKFRGSGAITILIDCLINVKKIKMYERDITKDGEAYMKKLANKNIISIKAYTEIGDPVTGLTMDDILTPNTPSKPNKLIITLE
jgi:hypothetical protein